MLAILAFVAAIGLMTQLRVIDVGSEDMMYVVGMNRLRGGYVDLDLIGYEYELDRPRAAAFVRGYESVLPLPNLRAVRPLYRYLYRLLEVQGSVELNIWLGWPAHFESLFRRRGAGGISLGRGALGTRARGRRPARR